METAETQLKEYISALRSYTARVKRKQDLERTVERNQKTLKDARAAVERLTEKPPKDPSMQVRAEERALMAETKLRDSEIEFENFKSSLLSDMEREWKARHAKLGAVFEIVVKIHLGMYESCLDSLRPTKDVLESGVHVHEQASSAHSDFPATPGGPVGGRPKSPRHAAPPATHTPSHAATAATAAAAPPPVPKHIDKPLWPTFASQATSSCDPSPYKDPYLDASQPFNLADSPDHVLSSRDMMVKDVWLTICAFVQNIDMLTEAYISPLTSRWHNLLSYQERSLIFHNLEDIQQLARELHDQCQPRVTRWLPDQRIGDVVYSVTPRMKHLFTSYANNFPQAESCIHDLRSQPQFSEYLYEGEAMCSYQLLETTLLLPVQFVANMTILMNDIVCSTSDAHPDYADLYYAKEELSAIAYSMPEDIRMKALDI